MHVITVMDRLSHDLLSEWDKALRGYGQVGLFNCNYSTIQPGRQNFFFFFSGPPKLVKTEIFDDYRSVQLRNVFCSV